MFNRISLNWVLLGLLIASGALPLVLAGVTGSLLFGIVALIVVAGAGAFWVSHMISGPLQKLIAGVGAIATDIEHQQPTTDLKAAASGAGLEITLLASQLQEARDILQRRLTELNSIHAISQTITSSTLDYEKTVKSVLAAVQRVVDYDAAEVAVLENSTLTVEAWWGKDGFKDTTGRKYRMGKGPTGIIAANKEPLFLKTVQPSEDLQRTIGYASVETEFIAKSTKLVISSFLGIPLLLGDRLIGTLTLVHHQPGYFSEDDMRQLEQLADHASIAIDNALQVREREKALKDQIRELKIEIDQAKLSAQVNEVTDTDFFRDLQSSAAKIRERRSRGNTEDAAESGESEPAPDTASESSDDHTEEPDS
ncbi:MAG: GAF domain-containing protein [Chloroflexi bacterium]|nr:GAF domain-containing protein [Chloroflexota bacterium]